MAARARHPRFGADVGVAAALGQQQDPQPGRRPECRQSAPWHRWRPGRRRSRCPSRQAFWRSSGRRPRVRRRARSPITAIQLASVSSVDSCRACRSPVATLARCLLSLIPTEQDSPVSAAMTVRIRLGQLDRVRSTVARRHRPRPNPTPRAGGRGRAAGPSPVRTPRRRRSVSEWQERRVRALAGGGAQRHTGVHPELPRRIRRACDDLARFGRVAVAADDHAAGRPVRGGGAFRRRPGTGRGRRAGPSASWCRTSLRATAFPRVAERLEGVAARRRAGARRSRRPAGRAGRRSGRRGRRWCPRPRAASGRGPGAAWPAR